MQSIYIHFPFCQKKCTYCDFYSLAQDRIRSSDIQGFERALIQEIQQYKNESSIESIFFGGGTPNWLDTDALSRIVDTLTSSTVIHQTVEWTMEANPALIGLKQCQAYRRMGINRISLGIQALEGGLLKTLTRDHTVDQALQALETVFQAGFENVSVDLICGIPGQTQEDLMHCLEKLHGFPITHLSCYILTLPPHHALFTQLPHEQEQLAHYLFVHDWMVNQGYVHYEISNYSKPHFECKHNLHYWKKKSYLGLGPSAHSYDASQKLRWKNVSSVHRYMSLLEAHQSPIESQETLTLDQQDLEKWMLSLRLSQGFPIDWLATDSQKKSSQWFLDEGLLEFHPEDHSRQRLTAKGYALSDMVISRFAVRG